MGALVLILFIFGLPLFFTIWFIVSVVRFIKSKSEENKVHRKNMIWMVVSGVLTILSVVGVVSLLISFSIVMQHM